MHEEDSSVGWAQSADTWVAECRGGDSRLTETYGPATVRRVRVPSMPDDGAVRPLRAGRRARLRSALQWPRGERLRLVLDKPATADAGSLRLGYVTPPFANARHRERRFGAHHEHPGAMKRPQVEAERHQRRLARSGTSEGPVLFTGDACHTCFGWDHAVEPGTFSLDQPESEQSLLAL